MGVAVSVGRIASVGDSVGSPVEVAGSEAGTHDHSARDRPTVRRMMRMGFKKTSFCDGIHKLFYCVPLYRQVI
jgi:hypothetical protein